MGFRFLKLVVVLVVGESVWSLPSGCWHNGRSYMEEEGVEAGEACLSCVCRKGALACSLRVCGDLLEAVPAGCLLVHKANECCPQLLCGGNFKSNGIEVRKTKTESQVGCVINGTTYGEGSAVASWDPCEYCYCAEGELKCVKPRCVQSFEGCKPVYEKSSCCPTEFDCRDAKVSFVTTRVNYFGDLNSNPSSDLLRSLNDSEPVTGQWSEDNPISESNSVSEGKTSEDFAVEPTEETTGGTTLDDLPETTTFSSADSTTTLRLQTTEDESQRSPTETTTAATEETTPEITSQMSSGEASEVERSPLDVTESADGRWNSSEVADDYDVYDYEEPELPPSLPNLVIFPFVAADAVVKDEKAELYDAGSVDRIDDQPVVYKDYFSPPTRTEGGFVPKQPLPDPYYELPFLTKKPTEPPSEGKQTAPKANGAPLEPESVLPGPNSFDGHRGADLPSDGVPSGELKQPFNEILQTEMAPEFFLNGVSDRKSQQTKKPVTVTYKNVVVDFYPDYLVTTTRSHSTASGESLQSHQPQRTGESTSVSINDFPDPILGLFDETTLLPTAELPQKVSKKPTPPPSTKKPSFFENFLKTFLSEGSTSTMSTLTSTKHKYSSKIKTVLATTPKPREQSHSSSFASPTALPPADSTEPASSRAGSPRDENKLIAADDTPPKAHPNPPTLLKLAGCNIYGMMYRIGKVIAELSGPCVECLCTDFGVQCNPLEC